MTNILQALIQDPAALAESFAAVLSGCYVLKLLLTDERAAFPETLSLETQPSFQALTILDKRLAGAPRAHSLAPHSLRSRLLRLFAVGETIIIPKKSLRRQRC